MTRPPNHYADLLEGPATPSTSPEWKRADQQKREEKRLADKEETKRIRLKRSLTLG